MFLIDSITSLFTIRWTQQSPQLRPLPPYIKRVFVTTPNGDLELLVCEPKSTLKPVTAAATTPPPPPPIFFVHGGYGSAGVWLEWFTYLYERNYPSTLYAYSARNHGASYTLPYIRMVFQTPFEHIQEDMLSCLNHAISREQDRLNTATRLPILAGHSSGGGLSQFVLSGALSNPTLRARASGLCLIDAIPSFGSYDIYWNWWKHDPWFTLRSMFHLQHPTSPLSSNRLVHGAFFGGKFPLSSTGEFARWMPAFESMGWPVGMVGKNFWGWVCGRGNEWLKCVDIVTGIDGVGEGGDKVCVIVGQEDMMYRPWMWEQQCAEYRDALGIEKGVAGLKDRKFRHGADNSRVEHVKVESKGGVTLVLVEDSGHHVQNDIYHKQAAEAFMRWAEQV